MTPVQQPQPTEGYEPFFGLREAPFSLAPDPRFLFASSSHAHALAQVAYALQRREPLVVLTGEIGTGKTLLCRTLLQRLPGRTFLSVITDPLLERDELLKQMLQDFGVISKDRTRLATTSRHDLVEGLHAFLHSLAPLQAHAVVIVDEAQHLQPDVLEQIRLLSNIDDQHGTALEIILVGQPDLEQLLARPDLRQLHQRVSRWLRLAALNRDEVTLYVEHRIARARDTEPAASADESEFTWDLIESVGAKRSVDFTTDAIDAVAQLSGGVPRVINLLCDRSLEEAYASSRRRIDGPSIQAAARELGIAGHTTAETPAGLRLAARRAETGRTASGQDAFGGDSVWPHLRSGAETPDQIAQPGAENPQSALAPSHAAFEIPLANDAVSEPPFEFAPLSAGAPEKQTATPKMARYALVAVVVVAAAGVVVLFGMRATRSGPAPAASPAVVTTPRTPAPPNGTATPAPQGAAGAGTPTSTAAGQTSGGEQFDLLIASFRTDARAASVAAEVAALGVPNRRRVSDGWQQVVAGPFASRAAAEAAQQRLDAAGLNGTQIWPAGR